MKKVVQLGVVFFAFNLFSFSVAQNAEKKISSAPSAEDFLNEINSTFFIRNQNFIRQQSASAGTRV